MNGGGITDKIYRRGGGGGGGGGGLQATCINRHENGRERSELRSRCVKVEVGVLGSHP